MIFKLVLGVDMSKDWFHYCLMNVSFEILTEGKIDNHPDAIFNFITELLKSGHINDLNEIRLCMEHTGIYIQHLVNCWLGKGGHLSVVHATKVSEFLAGQTAWEEKTDELDARRLAEYAFRYSDKLQIWQAENQTIVQLRAWQRQRERINKALNILEVPVNESIGFDSAEISTSLQNNQEASLNALKSDLKNIDKALQELMSSDPTLKQLFKLLKSVEGIGPVTARELIIATCAFTKFTPNDAKRFARFAGVVPVKKRSGKAVRKKDKITKRNHKKLKELLTMCAQSLIGSKQELGLYYQRKMDEGKHHLTVINAMRNKIILRAFAVVRNQVIYQKNLNVSLD